MLKASEAKKIALESRLKGLDAILSQIQGCAEKGDRQLTVSGSLTGEVWAELRDLGYHVSSGLEYNHTYTTISW